MQINSITKTRYLPWQASQWHTMQTLIANGELSHGWLVYGPEGQGKKLFAELLAQSMLCINTDKQGLPCQSCKQCLLFKAGNHPNYISVTNEADNQAIKIEAIRTLTQRLSITSHDKHYRIVLIYPAGRLNQYAANALLKTLEEPGENILFLLVTSSIALIPATIRSRCRLLAMPMPNYEMACSWLQNMCPEADYINSLRLAQGAPLLACEYCNNDKWQIFKKFFNDLNTSARAEEAITDIAKRWHECQDQTFLRWWWLITHTLIKAHLLGRVEKEDSLVDHDTIDLWLQKSCLETILQLNQLITEEWQYSLSNVPLNQSLLVDRLFLTWQKCFLPVKQSK